MFLKGTVAVTCLKVFTVKLTKCRHTSAKCEWYLGGGCEGRLSCKMARMGTVFCHYLYSIAIEHSVGSPGVWKICDLVLLFLLIFINDNRGWKITETSWL